MTTKLEHTQSNANLNKPKQGPTNGAKINYIERTAADIAVGVK